jgi:hypothetical protein
VRAIINPGEPEGNFLGLFRSENVPNNFGHNVPAKTFPLLHRQFPEIKIDFLLLFPAKNG